MARLAGPRATQVVNDKTKQFTEPEEEVSPADVLKRVASVYENVFVPGSSEAITLEVTTRYAFFIGGLLVLTIMPSYLRGIYLWGGTIASFLYCLAHQQLTFHLFLVAAAGVGHSAVHVIWPFLDEIQGFVPNVSALPDVFFHTIMLAFMYMAMRKHLTVFLDRFTIFCIFGAVLNCCLTGFKTVDKDSYASLLVSNSMYALFVITTAFQAISTGYWIACVLHYKEWHHTAFTYGLMACLTVIVSNWFWYQMDDIFQLGIGLVKLSMRFRYIEGLFIICTWVPLVFTEKVVGGKILKQKIAKDD